jgi:hypothetical protein
MRLIVFCLLTLGVCLSAASPRPSAQESKTPQPDKQSAPFQTNDTSVPQPSPEIQTLTKALAGTWSLSEKYEPIYLTPNGGVGTGEQSFLVSAFCGGTKPRVCSTCGASTFFQRDVRCFRLLRSPVPNGTASNSLFTSKVSSRGRKWFGTK